MAIVSRFSSHGLFCVFGPTLSLGGCHLYHTRAPPKHAAVHPAAGNTKSLLSCKVTVLRIHKSEEGLRFKDVRVGSDRSVFSPTF